MKRNGALWTSILAGPLIFALVFTAKFFLAYWVCAFGWKPAVHIISASALVVTAAAGALAWKQWQELGAETPGEGAAPVTRERSMAMAGLLMSGTFLIVLIALAVPEWMMAGCE